MRIPVRAGKLGLQLAGTLLLLLALLDLPPDELKLEAVKLDGHIISYRGAKILSYAVKGGKLAAFCGHHATGITVDEKEYRLTERPMTVAWAPVARRELAAEVRVAHRLHVDEPGDVRLPIEARKWTTVRSAVADETRAGERVAVRVEGDALMVSVAPGQQGRWLYVGDW